VNRNERAQATPRLRTRALLLSWLAYASYYLGRKGLSVTKAALVRAGIVGETQLAAIDTAFLAAYAFGQVPSGVLADRLGARRLVGLGLLGSALACTAFGAVSSAWALLACFALNGLAQSTGWPGTTRAVADHTSLQDRGRVMGLWSTCYQVGGLAATALAAWLLGHYGWRAVFQLPALWLALTGTAVLLWLPERPRAPEGAPTADAEQPRPAAPSAAPPVARAELLRLLRDPRVRSYGACYFCLKLIRYSLLFWLPYYLQKTTHFDDVQSGYLSIAFELGGVLGTIGLGFVSDRAAWGRAAAAAWSIVGLSIALLLYAWLPAGGALSHFALLALIGALLFGPDALLSGAAAQDAGGTGAAATAVGIVNGLGSLGALLQGALTLAVERAFGWHALFYVFVGLSLVACASLWPALRTTGAR
jgi:OPA family sugar phosphate sensor protein UhpC-like MFS transporter